MDFYDKDGSPITLDDWAKKIEDIEYKQIEFTKLSNCYVSTVWLGLDHSFGHGSPLIFETMIFGGPKDMEQYKYSTLEQAKIGHKTMVKLASEGDKNAKTTSR